MKKKNKSSRMKWIFFIVLFFMVIITLFGLLFNNKEGNNAINDLERYTVVKGNLNLSVIGSGKISSADIKKVTPDGTIKEVRTKVGDYVKKNTILGTYINNLGKTINYLSPYEGVITAIPQNSYNLDIPSSFFEISNIDKLQMEIKVTEKDIYKIKENAQASIYIDAIDTNVSGTVTRVSMAGETSSDFSFYNVTISFDNNNSNIFLGMTGSAKIIIMTKDNALKVPVDALIEKDEKRYVLESKWLVNSSEPQSDYYIEVETGISDSDYVEITKGDILNKEILVLPFEGLTLRDMMENH